MKEERTKVIVLSNQIEFETTDDKSFEEEISVRSTTSLFKKGRLETIKKGEIDTIRLKE
jgi:hypothetical protein